MRSLSCGVTGAYRGLEVVEVRAVRSLKLNAVRNTQTPISSGDQTEGVCRDLSKRELFRLNSVLRNRVIYDEGH